MKWDVAMAVLIPRRRAQLRGCAAWAVSLVLLAGMDTPLKGQTSRDATDESVSRPPRPTLSRAATSSPNDNTLSQTNQTAVGRAGQRQSRNEATGIVALQRLDTRIVGRVQTRLRTRIDRYYDPQANATSPFKVAGEQLRRGQPRR